MSPIQISNGVLSRFLSTIVSLCVLTVLFLQIDLRALLGGHADENSADTHIIKALLENREIIKEKRQDKVKFLSDRDSAAQGQLTREKGFESISTDYMLSQGELQPVHARLLSAKQYARILTSQESRSTVSIKPEKEKPAVAVEKLRIPSYYRFRHDFALSWDYAGRPAIPTARYAHYSYFRSMINKIQAVWAPPGGDPYPTFGDSYHRMNYAAGYTRFSTFPSQDIYIQFLLDENGVVRDAKMVSSLGYQSLDRSCIEALYSAHDFGPPPKELMEGGVLIVPFIFRIIVR